MKSLRDYILESSEESKTFTFDFTGIENGEDTVKSLSEQDCITVDGQKVTLKVCKDCSYDTAVDILQQTIEGLRKTQKSINDESYAQKTKKLQVTLSEVFDFIDILENPEEGEEESKDKDEDKNKKE